MCSLYSTEAPGRTCELGWALQEGGDALELGGQVALQLLVVDHQAAGRHRPLSPRSEERRLGSGSGQGQG